MNTITISPPLSYPQRNVVGTIHPSDDMYQGNAEHYFTVGLEAVRMVEQYALRTDRILDLPCGFGRITRALRARYPGAHIVASEVDPAGVAFCRKTFSVEGILSKTNFDALNFNQIFDVIVAGSLITHLNADATKAFLRFVVRHLDPTWGRAIISSHGAYVAGRLSLIGDTVFGLAPDQPARVLDDYFRDGFGYSDYAELAPNAEPYGVSLCTEEWLRNAVASIPNASVIDFRQHHWDRHHDIMVIGSQS